MIIHLKENTRPDRTQAIAEALRAALVPNGAHPTLVTSSALKTLPAEYADEVAETFVFDNDNQLASRRYRPHTREVPFGRVTIGGQTQQTLVIAGPCSVESRAQITASAELLTELGLTALRGGAFKPRTTPYSFQGLGMEGLALLAEMREKYGLTVITEVRDATHIEAVIEHTDVIQIGAKAMYDHGILRRCGQIRKPVLLKRGFGTTTQEFIQAAEFILSGGNEHVILCERGIRTFEPNTRFTLDLCGVAYLKQYTNLPIILDPSHAMGFAYGVPDLARACVAMGVDGLLIEVHPEPKVAKSDAAQQLDHDQFRTLLGTLRAVAQAVGRTIV